jgi:predicted  nucleic acid-binding Zn-ribbon protein
LQKQLEANSAKDDRTTLESQVNFLNDVIVELRNTNERLQKEIEFQKNPFVGDDEFSQNTTNHVKSSAPRLYCKGINLSCFFPCSFFIFRRHV